MLQLKSFFEGHRGAVTSLSGPEGENFFYSSGSDGLIVRWQRDLPNEGQVILKITGYIAAIVYDHLAKRIYAAVNQKGIYVIDTDLRKILRVIDTLPSSYGALANANKYLAVTTKEGEVLLIDKANRTVSKRIGISSSIFPSIALYKNILWYTFENGIRNIDLTVMKSYVPSITINTKPIAIDFVGTQLVAITEQKIISWNLNKRNKKQELIEPNVDSFAFMNVNKHESIVNVVSINNQLYSYHLGKKGFSLIEKLQIEHNGKINSILWIENHKFVITAGVDKKIGVWQVN